MRPLVNAVLVTACAVAAILTAAGCSGSGKDDARRNAEIEAIQAELARLKAQSAGQQPAQEPANKGSFTVVNSLGGNNSDPPVVLVELYQEGKIIRSRELKSGGEIVPQKVTWGNLAPGRYEVHFQAPGYEKFIKRLLISKEDADIPVAVEVSKKAVVVGGDGPSLQEMADELGRLKKENADLQARVESLQIEVNQLKKKESR